MDNASGEPSDAAAETSFDVSLYIYDLSKELAKSFKKILKGKPLPGIWHTGLVAYGREYYFGSTGIESCRPGETILGEPDQILTLGKTELPYSVFLEYIFALGESTYRPGTYHLLEHNCNCFSQEVCQFLTGGPIPAEIRELPQEISGNKNLSSSLKEYFDKLCLRAEGSKGISFGPANSVAEEHRNGHAPDHEPKPKSQQNGTRRKKSSSGMSAQQAQKELLKQSNAKQQEEEKQKQPEQAAAAAAALPPPSEKQNSAPVASASVEPELRSNGEPAEIEPPSTNERRSSLQRNGESVAAAMNNGDRLDEEEDSASPKYVSRRSRRYDDPPVIFPNIDGPAILNRLMARVDSKITPEEMKDLHEFMEYLTTDGGAWALGTSHLESIGRLLNDRNLPEEVPVLTLQMLQAAGLKEDVILLLHQDREKHHLMSYFYKIESLPPNEQTEVVGLLCNLCSNPSSYDWLTYISEWEEEGRPCNNSRVTVRVAVHGLLTEHPDTRQMGCALVYNLALKKELFEDIASELAMAVLQFLQCPPSEELMFQSLTALLRFMIISYNEIPALMKMMGPDVEAFRGVSARIDPVVEEIQMKLRVAR